VLSREEEAMNNDNDVQVLVERYRSLKALIRGDTLAAESIGATGAQSGSFSLRSMRVTLNSPEGTESHIAQAVLSHDLYHAVQVCQFPSAFAMLRALHSVDRWVTMTFLAAASLGRRWKPGDALLEALAEPSILDNFPRMPYFVRQSVEVLIESLTVRPSGLALLDLIEGAAYAVEQTTCQVLGANRVERPDRYTWAWREYLRFGGQDLQTFAMLVNACLREGSVAGFKDSYYAHPVDMFEHLVAYARYIETGDLSQVDESKVPQPQPPATMEESYRTLDYDPISLAGRSMQRFMGHLENWNPVAFEEDLHRLNVSETSQSAIRGQWTEGLQERARRIVKRLFMAYTRGATAHPIGPGTNERYVVDQFVELIRQHFSQIGSEALIWEVACDNRARAAVGMIVRQLAPAQIEVHLMDDQPRLKLSEFLGISQRILDFESVLKLERIDEDFESDEDPSPWIVACCPECSTVGCSHGYWHQNLPSMPTPFAYYGACKCESGLPESLRRVTGRRFQDLIDSLRED